MSSKQKIRDTAEQLQEELPIAILIELNDVVSGKRNNARVLDVGYTPKGFDIVRHVFNQDFKLKLLAYLSLSNEKMIVALYIENNCIYLARKNSLSDEEILFTSEDTIECFKCSQKKKYTEFVEGSDRFCAQCTCPYFSEACHIMDLAAIMAGYCCNE